MKFILLASLAFAPLAWGTVSLNGVDPLCDYFLAAQGTAKRLVSPEAALAFFTAHGRSKMSAKRFNRMAEALSSDSPGVVLAFVGDDIDNFFNLVPHSYQHDEHRAHHQAIGSTQRSSFAVALALSLWFMAGTQIPITPGKVAVGGFISGAIARWVIPLFYGKSYQDFEIKLYDFYNSRSNRALSFGHDIQGVDKASYVNLEILYAVVELTGKPTVTVHLSSRRDLRK